MTALRKLLPIVAALLVVTGAALRAQPSKGPPNALQGFSQNRDQPVHIEATTLEVRDKDKVATFSGDVRVKQGDTNMRCKSLVVFYEQDAEPGDKSKTMQAASPGPGGQQKIKRLEARGGVVVTQKDQTATGDTRHIRDEDQFCHALRQCGDDTRAERAARRTPDGRSDQRRIAGGIRQEWPGSRAGPVPAG